MDARLSRSGPGADAPGAALGARAVAALDPGGGAGLRGGGPYPARRPADSARARRSRHPPGDGAWISLLGGAWHDAAGLGASRAGAGRGRAGTDTAGHGHLAGHRPETGRTVMAGPTG